MSPEIAPLPRNLRLGDYLIERMLARGGFGFTYLAIREPDMQRVVIKENFPCLGCTREVGQYAFIKPVKGGVAKKGGEEWSARNFRNEVMALRVLDHPSVAKVLDDFYVPETGTSYYVMPYYPGGALSEALEFGGSVNRDGVLYLAAALMDALEHIHGMGMLHRDVKPQNVVFSAEGVPVLVDFGAARLSDSACPTRIVSDEFAPQEQRKGERQGPWTDIYALGATLYLTITGKHVPDAATRSREVDSYVPLSGQRRLVRLYGFRFLETVDRALSLKPENRYSSVRQWREVLHDEPGFQHETPVRPVPGSLLVEKKSGCVPNTQLMEGPKLASEAMSQDPGIHDGVPYAEARARRGRKVALCCVLLVLLIGLLGGLLSVVLLPGKTGHSAVAICFATPEKLCEWGDKATRFQEQVALYCRAAEKGYALAMYRLGEAYATEEGIKQDADAAERWYRQAAEKGHADAQYRLAVICENKDDKKTAVDWYTKAGKQGQAEAMVALGEYFFSGTDGAFTRETELNEAEKWFRRAEKKGVPRINGRLEDIAGERKKMAMAAKLQQAQSWLNNREDGARVQLFHRKAVGQLLELAAQEMPEAQLLLAECYHEGRGVPTNAAEAAKWYTKAVTLGMEEAERGLQRLEAEECQRNRCKDMFYTGRVFSGEWSRGDAFGALTLAISSSQVSSNSIWFEGTIYDSKLEEAKLDIVGRCELAFTGRGARIVIDIGDGLYDPDKPTAEVYDSSDGKLILYMNTEGSLKGVMTRASWGETSEKAIHVDFLPKEVGGGVPPKETNRKRRVPDKSASEDKKSAAQNMERWLDYHKKYCSSNDSSFMKKNYEPTATNLKTGAKVHIKDHIAEYENYIQRWPKRQYDVKDYKILGNRIEIRSRYNHSKIDGKQASGYCKTTYLISPNNRIQAFADDSSNTDYPAFSPEVLGKK